MNDADAIVVGSGPNGLAAAITLQQQGLSVLLLEAKPTVGGGLRSAELTLPGYVHDVCSAIHPLALASPFFRTLPLHDHGLAFVQPALALAHPFDNGRAVALYPSLAETAKNLGADGEVFQTLLTSMIERWPAVENNVLGPLRFPSHPLALAKFGLKALPSAMAMARKFSTAEAKGLWAGMAAHSMLPLDSMTTAAIGWVLCIAAFRGGWPVAKGGSQQIANALASYFVSIGGKIETNTEVKSLSQLPNAKAVLLDVTPRQVLGIAGHKLSSLYTWQLKRYRYGMGVFKVDWALDGAVPFAADICRQAGTLHIGSTLEEIRLSEAAAADGRYAERPFVLFAQQSVADPSRAPQGKHVAWAYCHTPNGSTADRTAVIEKQVERFAPGFRDRILARHTLNSAQLEQYNFNYVGGDINGGVLDLGQLFTRPVLRASPYRTSLKGLYICSSATPPGGGVHGLCGHYAARRALKDIFGISVKPLL
ncbi:phytoene desaturase family protein [Chryseolinea lacunae]|uniref:NAD(P)/FAD-dependent oxidoreductase n=1 Tax=Chryseolinea lacunae TaxID=2801331 RepID=A0ABS1L001_9BACT|nr:NAD(P)/FAD-dependent oxidoreductase [Chryseolinea lacunae]MBL0745035.1 NAD(P)/FAD-dependent oxidoreductase [Chryseolinea lacunae]